VYQRTSLATSKQALLSFEQDKVGGSDNYALVSKASLLQVQQQLPQIKEFINGQGGQTTGQAAEMTKLTQEQYDAIVKNAPIEGDANGDIIMVEYSDPECPFCIRQAQDKTIEKVLEKYPSGVGHIFKTHQGVNHAHTAEKSKAIICAFEVGGLQKYVKFYKQLFARSSMQNQDAAGFPVANIDKLAKEIGIDAKKFAACRNNDVTAQKYNTSTAEGTSLGVTGTPVTVIINKKTLQYNAVKGAYPAEKFFEIIESLKK
jgi:protein-disulfide isomerase